MNLYFAKGMRPALADLQRFLPDNGRLMIAFNAASNEANKGGDSRPVGGVNPATSAILQLESKAFSIEGLFPAAKPPPSSIIDCAHFFDLSQTDSRHEWEAVALRSVMHSAQAERSLTVLRDRCAIAAELAKSIPYLRAIGWSHAKTLIGPAYFVAMIEAWTDDGLFPAEGLTAFKPDVDGGLQSSGLAFFTGQELRLEPPLADDMESGTKLAVRLIRQLVVRGKLDRAESVTAPDGRSLRLEPSRNGRFVRVWAD